MARKSSTGSSKRRRAKAGLKVGARAKAGVRHQKIKADVGTKAHAGMEDLDGWIPYDISNDGEVLASEYLPNGLHISRGFDPVGPWEKISDAMRLSKEFTELTEWLPEVVLEFLKNRLDHKWTTAKR